MTVMRDPLAERRPMQEHLDGVLSRAAKQRAELDQASSRDESNYVYNLSQMFNSYRDIAYILYSLGEPVDVMLPYVNDAVEFYVRRMVEEDQRKKEMGDSPVTWVDAPVRMIGTGQFLGLVNLIGTAEQVARIGETLHLLGPDTALEFLGGLHPGGLDGVEVTLSDPRPYARLVKVVQAAPKDRAKFNGQFLRYWYGECRKAQWWGRHLQAEFGGEALCYEGYWCFEGAALTKLLGIDDGSYRDSVYYPRDLVSIGGLE